MKAKNQGLIPNSSTKGAVIVNRGSRNEKDRRASAFGGAGSVLPVSGRHVGIPSQRTTDREASGQSEVNLSVSESLDALEDGQIMTSALISGNDTASLAANGGSELSLYGSEIKSSDLVGKGNGVRLVDSSETEKDVGVPTSTINRRSNREDMLLSEVIPDSNVLVEYPDVSSNDKPSSSDVPVRTTNERPAAPTGPKAAVILRSEPYLTQMDPVDIMAEHSGEQFQSETMSGFFGSPKRDSEIRGDVLEVGVGIMGDNAVGVSGGSKVHEQKSDNPELVGVSGGNMVHVQNSLCPEVVPGRASSCAGHDPLGSTMNNGKVLLSYPAGISGKGGVGVEQHTSSTMLERISPSAVQKKLCPD